MTEIKSDMLVAVLGEILDAAVAIAGADFGNVQLLDNESSDLKIVTQRGFPQWWLDYWNSVSKGQGVCGTALEQGRRIIVEDVEQSPIFVGSPALDVQRRAGVRAVQSTPVVSRWGKPLGMFSTHYRTPHRPDDRTQLLLDLLARQAADAIERMQAEETLEEGFALSQALDRINALIHSTFDVQTVLQGAMTEGCLALRAETAACSLRDEGYWKVSAVKGLPPELVGTEMDDQQEKHAKLAVETRRVVAINDAFNDDRVDREHMRKHNIRSVLVVPLFLRKNPPGVIFFNHHARTVAFTGPQIDFAEKLSFTVSIAVENSDLHQTQVKTENELRESELQLRSVFNSPSVHLGIVEDRGDDILIIRANRALAALYGLDPGVMEGRRASHFNMPQSIIDDQLRNYRNARQSSVPAQWEYCRTGTGQEQWFLASASYLGTGLQGYDRYSFVAHDITERKCADEALRRSEEKYRTLFDRMINGFAYHRLIEDEKGKPIDYVFLEANSAFERLTGLNRRDIVGKRVTEVLPGIENDPADWIGTYGRVALTGRDIQVERHAEVLGKWFWVSAYSPAKGFFATIFEDISARKIAEQALQESERKFFLLFQKAGFGAALATFPEGVFVDVNEEAERMFGYSRQDVLGKTSVDLGLDADPGMRARIIARLVEQGIVRDFEVILRTKSREERPFLLNMIGLELGGRKHYIVTLVDITKRKRAEEALRQSHQDLEQRVRERTTELQESHAQTVAILESIRDGFYAMDREWRVTYVNTEATHIWGMPRSDLMGRTIWEIAPEARGTIYEKMFQQALQDHVSVVFEATSPIAAHLVEVRAYPTGSGLSVFFHDITERRKDEEARRLLASAVDSTAEAIAITDRTGMIQFVNPAFAQMTGYSRAEARGLTLHILDSGQHDETFYRTIRSELARTGVWQGRMISRKKDGARYFEDCVISAVKTDSGDIANYISTRRDVTERIRFESIAAAMNTTENIGYVFSGVRHEIGNPINTVKLSLSLLKERLDKASKGDIAESIECALNELHRVERLLVSLRTFNLYETPVMEVVEFRPFLDDFGRLVRRDLGQKRITLTSSIGGGAERLFADPRVLHQVLLNIITNAVDALEGQEEGRISIVAEAEGAVIHIRITDNGCGMTQEVQQRLFRPFATTKPGGTGLGLVIVRRMLAQMGGSIEITSEPGIGTVVDISMRSGEDNDGNG